MNKFFQIAAVLMMGLAFTACSSDDNESNNNTGDDAKYKDKTYGITAIDACAQTVNQLVKANEVIAK